MNQISKQLKKHTCSQFRNGHRTQDNVSGRSQSKLVHYEEYEAIRDHCNEKNGRNDDGIQLRLKK